MNPFGHVPYRIVLLHVGCGLSLGGPNLTLLRHNLVYVARLV